MRRNRIPGDSPTVYIISWYGIDRMGGVERVVGILKRIIEKEHPAVVLDRDFLETHKVLRFFGTIRHPVVLMVIFSIYSGMLRRKGSLLIGNGFQAPFVKKDISFAHGTMYDLKKSLGQPVWSGSTPFERISMRNSRRIIAVSEDARTAVIEHYGIDRHKIRVINNCVDTDIFFPVSKEQNACTILFCGRLEERKGLSLLRKLAAEIGKRQGIRLSVASTDTKNTELLSGLKNVTVQSGLNPKEMNQFYNSGNVLFLPSKFEGFEMVTLEALSAGIPVVGNRVGAIRELLEAGFEAVHEIKSDTVIEILQQLITVAREYSGSFRKRQELHCRVEKRFGIDEYAKKILDEVEKAIAVRSGQSGN